ALGPNHEVVDINGRTTGLGAGGTFPGGLLAVGGGTAPVFGQLGPNVGNGVVAFVPQGNIGRFTSNRFVVAPEVGIEAGVYVTSHVRLSVGYNYLYMSDVARPGQQVTLGINPRFVPTSPAFGSTSGQSQPRVTGQQTEFHAQGVQFGVEVKY